ncbi:oxidoreductase NAD-binding domain-containing protein 1-like [Dendronephthya gigantea]|uniref:oxidoreductase NAD-binding domain-containing protein 1-like n=1 Tax=Dendronephthya gigantea TaxID=151771 RepID=UPI00106A5B1C|nr:oxidoreductase NAD-binding domain-containing protein 1-like [Dendronephthya gigantea]
MQNYVHFRNISRVYRHMSKNVTSTHMEKTISKQREPVTAVGRIVQIAQLSKTVKEISIHVPNVEFKFKAGQWVDFMIPGVETVGGFSMTSSPAKLEKHRIIDLAVKRSDHPPAHWVHSQCRVGDEVSLTVGGDFFYDPMTENSKQLLFIAGGVGINPLYSIIQQIYQSLKSSNLDEDVKFELLYSASDLHELIFKDELDAIAEATGNFKCQMFVTRDKPATNIVWGRKVKLERISAQVLEETLRNFNTSAMTVFVCGPPSMIQFITSALKNAGVSNSNIKQEQWW